MAVKLVESEESYLMRQLAEHMKGNESPSSFRARLGQSQYKFGITLRLYPRLNEAYENYKIFKQKERSYFKPKTPHKPRVALTDAEWTDVLWGLWAQGGKYSQIADKIEKTLIRNKTKGRTF